MEEPGSTTPPPMAQPENATPASPAAKPESKRLTLQKTEEFKQVFFELLEKKLDKSDPGIKTFGDMAQEVNEQFKDKLGEGEKWTDAHLQKFAKNPGSVRRVEAIKGRLALARGDKSGGEEEGDSVDLGDSDGDEEGGDDVWDEDDMDYFERANLDAVREARDIGGSLNRIPGGAGGSMTAPRGMATGSPFQIGGDGGRLTLRLAPGSVVELEWPVSRGTESSDSDSGSEEEAGVNEEKKEEDREEEKEERAPVFEPPTEDARVVTNGQKEERMPDGRRRLVLQPLSGGSEGWSIRR